MPSVPKGLNPQEILSDDVFTVEEVEKQLIILNVYKSTGTDGLGPRILKETAKRKATKMIPESRNLSYERRLQRLELISLEQRRQRGQLIEALTMSLWKGFSKETLTYEPEITAKNYC
ncbi:hypothetical protein FHG87_017071 [Trinorchestia longiramus]|nr:hypothetical protein FHG87_017071 [Trinorchestia longiramus]